MVLLEPKLMSLQNREYKRAELIAVGLRVPDEKVCQTCHNSKSAFFQPFDYAPRKAQGMHEHTPLKYAHE